MTSTPASRGWLAPAPPTVAIEIANRRVTAVGLSYGARGAVVTASASEALPPQAVTAALSGTNIADKDLVAGALRRVLDRAGLRSARRAALVVPDSIARVSLLPFETVPSRPAELDQLVRWQLRKATPFAIEEAQVSHFRVHDEGAGATLAAVVARRDVLAEYEGVAQAAGLHAGIVDLASFNVMNAILAAGAASVGEDWLLVCLAAEATTLAILRGRDLMFYRHRTAVDEEPLSALVHQTAMYHEDRLGGGKFSRVWLCGAALASDATGAERARREIGRLGVAAEAVDVRRAATLDGRVGAAADDLDALAAPVGILLRERRAA